MPASAHPSSSFPLLLLPLQPTLAVILRSSRGGIPPVPRLAPQQEKREISGQHPARKTTALKSTGGKTTGAQSSTEQQRAAQQQSNPATDKHRNSRPSLRETEIENYQRPASGGCIQPWPDALGKPDVARRRVKVNAIISPLSEGLFLFSTCSLHSLRILFPRFSRSISGNSLLGYSHGPFHCTFSRVFHMPATENPC